MNQDILKGKWMQLKGKVKQKWAKLTDSDLTRIEGNVDEAVGRIQERYGRTKDQAEREWREFYAACDSGSAASPGCGDSAVPGQVATGKDQRDSTATKAAPRAATATDQNV